ncbi:hypothetical protein CLOSTMETH_00404 [[Clostridium] methylpentosum DSM 5476]|uniref:Uncharacterized protein n=1 Tax=[Clostridium] methylpentosum DSM 5476 TaxID=537013 RepID=C0E9A6_9FIRM|nr:hypothetical protein CLOSTMETH_00404 [[Clostridium] methylpentosum DSM 5476]
MLKRTLGRGFPLSQTFSPQILKNWHLYWSSSAHLSPDRPFFVQNKFFNISTSNC